MYVVNIEVSGFNSLVDTNMIRDLLSLSDAVKSAGDELALFSEGYLPDANQLRILNISVTHEDPSLTLFYQTEPEAMPSASTPEIIIRKCFTEQSTAHEVDTGDRALPYLAPLGRPWNYDPMKRPVPVNRQGVPFDAGWVMRNFG